MTPHRFAFAVLEAGGSGYAAAAAHALIDQQPTLAEKYGTKGLASWRSFMMQAVAELTAAVRFNRPELFTAAVRWIHGAFLESGRQTEDLRVALQVLHATLHAELPENAHEPVMRCMQAALQTLDAPLPQPTSPLDPADPCGRLTLRYLAACLEGRFDSAAAIILNEARLTLGDAAIYLQVLMPAQREIGRMWHAGEISVAEEHAVSSMTRRLAVSLSAAEPRTSTGKTVLTASVAGDAHDIGITAVADFFRAAGWRSVSLGANVPVGQIAEAAEIFQAQLVALSTTLTTQLPALEDSVVAIRAVGREIKILVGGRALSHATDLWREIGADGYARSPEDAVEQGARLVGLSRPPPAPIDESA
jgi:methanogenic corrinoid protein MtbC1